MAEKNIAALLREDAKTIRVTFNGRIPSASSEERQERLYCYVTHLDVQIGDQVLVPAAGELKVVTVMDVDQEVEVPPNAEYELRWVIMKIDMTEHEANMERNAEIERVVQEAYRANLRRSFAHQIMAGIDDSAKANLTKLLGGK